MSDTRKNIFANQLAFVSAHFTRCLEGLDPSLAALIERSKSWDVERFFEEGNSQYRVAINHAYAQIMAKEKARERNQRARGELAALGRCALALIEKWDALSGAEKERLLGLDLLLPLFARNYREQVSQEAREVWFGNACTFSSTFSREDVEAVFERLLGVAP